MKINIHTQGNERDGYVNVPFPADIGMGIVLDPFVDDGEAEEIIAYDVVDRFPSAIVDNMLSHWTRKLSHGGILAFDSIDIVQVSKLLVTRNITPEDANALLHGEYGERRAAFCMADMVHFLEKSGLTILKKRWQSYRATVVAQRP